MNMQDKKWTLAIDTCCGYLSFALLCREENICYTRQKPMRRGAAEAFFPELTALLEEASVSLPEIKRVGVTRGPGSFTSVRLGLSAVKGFQTALSMPAYGWNTLEVIAKDYNKACTVLLAAHGEHVFVQRFGEGGAPETEPVSMTKSEIFETVSGCVIGDAPLKWAHVPETMNWVMDASTFKVNPETLAKITEACSPENTVYLNALDALYVHPLTYKKQEHIKEKASVE